MEGRRFPEKEVGGMPWRRGGTSHGLPYRKGAGPAGSGEAAAEGWVLAEGQGSPMKGAGTSEEGAGPAWRGSGEAKEGPRACTEGRG